MSTATVTVYRFTNIESGGVTPQHMWGTPDAIEAIRCVLLPETAREVPEDEIEDGFYFEQAPSVYVRIEEFPEPGNFITHRRDPPEPHDSN